MPYPFSAGEILTAVNINAAIPKRFNTTGNAAAGYTNEGVVATLNVGAQTVDGNLMVWGTLFSTKTVAADLLEVRLRLTNLAGSVLALDQSAGGTQHTGHPICQRATTAGVGITIVMTVDVTGAGSGTVFADATNNRIDALWVPLP